MTVFLVQPQEPPHIIPGKSYLSLIFMAFHSISQGKGIKNPFYFLYRGRRSIFFPPLTIPTCASRGGPKSTSWSSLAAAFWARMELCAPHRGGLVWGGGPTAPAAPTWVSNGHRGLGVATNLGAVLGVEEVDSKLLELAVVEEGVYICQLQQGYLHLLSGLTRLEDQLTLREDVVLEEKEQVCSG